jgi:hypothetical protein
MNESHDLASSQVRKIYFCLTDVETRRRKRQRHSMLHAASPERHKKPPLPPVTNPFSPSPDVLASVDSVATELLLRDAEDLVELDKTLGTRRSTSLDLSSVETDNKVPERLRNDDILSLSGTVRDHDTPAGGGGVLSGLDFA